MSTHVRSSIYRFEEIGHFNFLTVFHCKWMIDQYPVKPVLSSHPKRRPKLGFQDWLSLNAGQKYCRMLHGEHSAILLTFIKLPFVFKIFTWSIFEWPFYKGFTVVFFLFIAYFLKDFNWTYPIIYRYMGLFARKPVFRGLQTTKRQTSLRICAVWSAPLLFAFWKVPYLGLLQAKFQISS